MSPPHSSPHAGGGSTHVLLLSLPGVGAVVACELVGRAVCVQPGLQSSFLQWEMGLNQRPWGGGHREQSGRRSRDVETPFLLSLLGVTIVVNPHRKQQRLPILFLGRVWEGLPHF